MRALGIATALALAAAQPAAAGPPNLALPIECQLGTTCFVEDHVDHDPAPGPIRDHACGLNTRDGHDGTDIALLDFGMIERGVAVLAAAPGQVLRTRDSMPDDRLMRGVTDDNACGNAVLLDHGDGWQTLYCHMRLGSIAVAPGDNVGAGAALGLVGLSGRTNHPHLHLTVFKDGKPVDPFRPDGAGSCGPPGATLWADPPAYTPTLLRDAGFSDAVPGYAALRAGTARKDRLPPGAPLVVYAEAGFAETGDVLTISARGPGGEVFHNSRVFDAPQVSQLPAFGRKAPQGGWPEGEYLGEILLERAGKVIAHRFAHVTVAAP